MVRKKSTPSPEEAGRPKKHTPYTPTKPMKYTYKEVKEALRDNHGAIYKTCDVLDINHETLRRYRKRWPQLNKYIKRYKKAGTQRVVERLLDMALNGDWSLPNTFKAIAMHLAAEEPGKYGRKKEVNNIGQVNVNNVQIPQLTPEKKQEMLLKVRQECELRRKQIQSLRSLEIGLKELPTTSEITGEVLESGIIIDNNQVDGSNNIEGQNNQGDANHDNQEQAGQETGTSG